MVKPPKNKNKTKKMGESKRVAYANTNEPKGHCSTPYVALNSSSVAVSIRSSSSSPVLRAGAREAGWPRPCEPSDIGDVKVNLCWAKPASSDPRDSIRFVVETPLCALDRLTAATVASGDCINTNPVSSAGVLPELAVDMRAWGSYVPVMTALAARCCAVADDDDDDAVFVRPCCLIEGRGFDLKPLALADFSDKSVWAIASTATGTRVGGGRVYGGEQK